MGKLVVASGHFCPLHTGHLHYLEAAAQLGPLLVIVNNDQQLRLKRGCEPFQNEQERLSIVRALRCVNTALLAIDTDRSVNETLRLLHALLGGIAVFANGGDVDEISCREWGTCDSLGIQMVFGVGGPKTQSSSSLLAALRV